MLDQSLLQEFIIESEEHLDEMEASLLLFETEPENKENLDNIFRSVHSIKGSAEYMGFEKIAKLSHSLENLLEILRKGEISHNKDITDALIEARDRAAFLIADIDEGGEEKTLIDDIIIRINDLSKNSTIDSSTTEPKLFADKDQEIETISFKEINNEKKDNLVYEEEYDDEYDEELFEIFIQYLKENIVLLEDQVKTFNNSENKTEILIKCIDTINSLKSSANYMDFKKLIDLYENWIKDIEKYQEVFFLDDNNSNNEFFETAFVYLNKIVNFFPSHLKISEEFISSFKASESSDKNLLFTEPDKSDQKQPESQKDQYQNLYNELDNLTLDTSLEKIEKLNLFENDSFKEKDENNLFLETDSDKDLKTDLQTEKKDINEFDKKQQADEDLKIILPEEVKNIAKSQLLKKGTSEKIAKQSIRIESSKIDFLMNQTGELIVNRAGFLQILNDMTSFQEYLTDNKLIEQNKTKEFKKLLFKLSEANISLGRVANELQDGVMKARMQPISKLFNRYPRLVRELTYGSDKKVKLNISGIETELDKMVIQEISDPIVHIIRNAVDHGIETTEDRISAGKNEEGNLNLKAYHEGNHVVVEISDDGKGIDPHEIKKIALKKNMMHINELEKLNSREIISLIMKPGFSTSKKITKTSGRGVGMDVVKKNIDKLNGIIEIDSKKGVKTLIRIKLPLTIAIIKALLVRIGNDIFTIPLASVEKTLTVYKKEIFVIENVEVIQLSDSVLSLMRLSEIFNIKSFTTDTDKVFVVIINTGMRKIGIVVDSLLGQEEIVIKPLADYLIAESGFSGATLLGDGKISLILDVYELVNIFINKQLKRKKTASALDTKLQNNNILPDSLNTQEAYTLH